MSDLKKKRILEWTLRETSRGYVAEGIEPIQEGALVGRDERGFLVHLSPTSKTFAGIATATGVSGRSLPIRTHGVAEPFQINGANSEDEGKCVCATDDQTLVVMDIKSLEIGVSVSPICGYISRETAVPGEFAIDISPFARG
jgi:hypothetical protein